jgi:limonene-1,2-epoxide hydrolase
MRSEGTTTPIHVLYELHAAQNKHDLEKIVACFAQDSRSEQPAHPGFELLGREEIRRNWNQILSRIPDLRSELLRSIVDGKTVWAEWRWRGTQSDGALHEVRGIAIFNVENDEIVWARWYMEPVRQAGASSRD